MSMLEKIPGLDEKDLKSLEANAKRLKTDGTPGQQRQAEMVVLAVEAERRRRKDAEDQRRSATLAAIADRVKDLGLFDRVTLAFTEMPPRDWEAEALKAVAAHPGQDFNSIAAEIGASDGAYINLAIGTLCADRQAYLGPAPMRADRKDQKLNSGLLIDFTPHEKDGRKRHGWTLKSEAEAALRQLKII